MSKALLDLRAFLDVLRRCGELVEVEAEVDPNLEAAEIHRRVIESGGPALLFKHPRGSEVPLVTNLFGTVERVQRAFGTDPQTFVTRAVEMLHDALPPSAGALWRYRDVLRRGLGIGLKKRSGGPVFEVEESPDLTRLPVSTSWHSDGGPFFTLPLVYTEHPKSGVHNLGMYRMQVHGPATTGMHFQVHKGGGFHLHEAEQRGEDLPASVFLGGPPAMILAAIAPLPEDVPELLLASLLLGRRVPVVRRRGRHPVVATSELCLQGRVLCGERRLEGPFGDHYGYNSLAHEYPVFQVDRVFRRRDAMLPATVVGRPRQEDFFIGDYLQQLLSPLFPLVMPSVLDLWSYGETGFHSLAAARVKERYGREALGTGLRILGEGQLSLTKCLMLTDQPVALSNFRTVLESFLERADFERDVIVLGETAMDTLDYTGPMVNRGSKAIFLGVGDVRRSLPAEFAGDVPPGVARARAFCRGCLVLQGKPYEAYETQAADVARHADFAAWPLLVLVDDLDEATRTEELFLWTVFTRFEPASDLHAKAERLERFHVSLEAPLVFDARMRPSYPPVMAVDEATKAHVDRRWDAYGIDLR